MNRRRFLTLSAAAAALLRAGRSLANQPLTTHPMNILVLTGSPRPHGNCNYPAESFSDGGIASLQKNA